MRTLPIVAATLCFQAMLAGAGAQSMPENVQRGEELSRELCSQCHRALPGEQSAITSGAIAFQDLAADPDRSIESLRSFMSTHHPFMPFDKLDPQQREDILAYMVWLLPHD